jgi:hypothetical protein
MNYRLQASQGFPITIRWSCLRSTRRYCSYRNHGPGQQISDILVKMFSRIADEGPDKTLDVEIPDIFIVSFRLVITASVIMQ